MTLNGRRMIYLRDLLHELVARDIKARYEGAVLGIAWSVMNPLLLLLVFHFLFRYVLTLDIPRYSSFTFSAILVWTWFQMSVFQSAGTITSNRELVKSPGFPPAILPAVTVTTNLIHFVLALPVLMLFLLIDGTGLRLTILALPIVMGLQFVLTLSLAYLVATANVIFRDTQHLLGVLLQLLFFLCPIFYDPNAVPARYQPMYRLNPMVHLIDAYRAVLLRNTLPDLLPLAAIAVLAAALLYVGIRSFMQASHRFVEEL
jgi:lipopolysaccharide transport system permease protein